MRISKKFLSSQIIWHLQFCLFILFYCYILSSVHIYMCTRAYCGCAQARLSIHKGKEDKISSLKQILVSDYKKFDFSFQIGCIYYLLIMRSDKVLQTALRSLLCDSVIITSKLDPFPFFLNNLVLYDNFSKCNYAGQRYVVKSWHS